jgi:hypothetical protein
MKILKIIVDSEQPLIDLLNRENFEVLKTEREDTFAMTRRLVERPVETNYELYAEWKEAPSSTSNIKVK